MRDARKTPRKSAPLTPLHPPKQAKASKAATPAKAAKSAKKSARPAKAPKPAKKASLATAPSDEAASGNETGSDASGGRGRRRRSGGRREAINEQLVYATFVVDNPIGSIVEGTVDRFSSHGAYVHVGDAQCYVPLRDLGNPPPRSAREVLTLGDTRPFVVHRFDPVRRGIDVVPATGGIAKSESGRDVAKAVASATGSTKQTPHAEEAHVSPAAKKAPARRKKAAAKKAPARRKKTAAKRAPARKKSTARKSTARKSTAKKATRKKAPARKKKAPARKKAAAKRSTARKSTARKSSARKSTAKKATRKKAPARKKRAAAKKTTRRR